MNQTGILLVILLLFPVLVVGDEIQTPGDPEVLVVISTLDSNEPALQSVITTFTAYGLTFQVASSESTDIREVAGYTIQPLNSALTSISSNTPLLILGGDDIDTLLASDALARTVQDRFHQGILVGAVDSGILLLGEAGILNGTTVASLPDEADREKLIAAGAVLEDSEGVVDDLVVTATGMNEMENLARIIVGEVIAQDISDTCGIMYLGDTENSGSYVIPQRIRTPIIHAAQNGTILSEWNGEPFSANIGEKLLIPVGRDEWTLYVAPENDVCFLYDPFTELIIPYGPVMFADAANLGSKRDFTTNTISIDELFRDISFKDIYMNSSEFVDSNKTLQNWTIEINNTNISVQETVALLYEDVNILDPAWIGLNAEVCIEGKNFGKGRLDILEKRGDAESSIAFDEEEISGSGCYEILLTDEVKGGSTGYLTVFSKEGVLIRDKEIRIPTL